MKNLKALWGDQVWKKRFYGIPNILSLHKK